MISPQIVRADRVSGSILGGVGVREFAAREFPREDVHWVAAQLARPATARVAGSGRWGRFWKALRTPARETAEPEATPEPAAA